MHRRHAHRWNGLPSTCLLAGAMSLVAVEANAAEPSNTGKRFRFHGETDLFGVTHFNPDGNGDNTNTVGFGFGRLTGIDASLAPPMWALGLGYIILDGNAIVGGRFSFAVNTTRDEDQQNNDGPRDDTRVTVVGGQFVPYFRYLFRPGRRVRPFLEGRFGLLGVTTSVRNDDDSSESTTNAVGPIVGISGGAHFFIVDAFSVDVGGAFDYVAPHSRTERRDGDVREENDYSKNGDAINFGIVAGFSAWF